MDEFSIKVPSHSWPKLNETQVQFNELNVMLSKYQNPKEADAMTKIQQDLDDTKIILVKIFIIVTCKVFDLFVLFINMYIWVYLPMG